MVKKTSINAEYKDLVDKILDEAIPEHSLNNKKVWEHEPELHAKFDKIWAERKQSILSQFDDRAFIATAEENMTEEEKRQPLFIAYRAATKPEAERNAVERAYYKMFASAFDLVSALQENATKKIKKGRKKGRQAWVREPLVHPRGKWTEERLKDAVDHLNNGLSMKRAAFNMGLTGGGLKAALDRHGVNPRSKNK